MVFLITVHEVSKNLEALVFGFPRIGVPQTLVEKKKSKLYWTTTLMSEYEMENDVLVHPHVILMSVRSCNVGILLVLKEKKACPGTYSRGDAEPCAEESIPGVAIIGPSRAKAGQKTH